jgi:N-methylhydantoinase A
MACYRLTVDTGGTFSDFVYRTNRPEISVAKLSSTPEDPSRAILAGVEVLLAKGVQPADISYFCHGMTVGTNALLEGKGVRTGLLVTKGFRGIYVAEQCRPHGRPFSTFSIARRSWCLRALPGKRRRECPRPARFCSPDEAALRATIREMAQEGLQSVAVCLLFSPEHEERARAIIAEEILGCAVSRRPTSCRRSANITAFDDGD